MRDKRQHSRIGVSFPIECKALPSRDYFYTVSKNLSLGGVRILSNTFLPKDDHLKLSINLIDKILSFTAKVAWCNKERLSERYTTGLEFIETSELAKNDLSAFLNSVFES